MIRRAPLALLAAGAACLLLASCSKPLPEADSPDAKLYAARCGTCHVAYQPGTLTPHMWQIQVDRMDQKYRAAGTQPPTGAEKEQLMAYLTRHAGG